MHFLSNVIISCNMIHAYLLCEVNGFVVEVDSSKMFHLLQYNRLKLVYWIRQQCQRKNNIISYTVH